MAKLSQEEIQAIKSERKATRQHNQLLYQEYLNRPIPPFTSNEKLAMIVMTVIAIVVVAWIIALAR